MVDMSLLDTETYSRGGSPLVLVGVGLTGEEGRVGGPG